LELLLELPWNEYSKDNFDLKRAENFMRSFWIGRGKKENDRASSCIKIKK
jgi:ATP-dependent Lon protease